MNKVLILIVSLALGGCVMLSSSPVTVKNLAKTDKGPKVVTFLNNTPYIAEMSISLAENGFTVKPTPSQQQVLEFQRQGKIVKYNEATTRWGISIQTKDSGMKCAFTDYNIYHFTLVLTDIYNNQVVQVLKQKGSDGPCTSVEPVFGTLAEQLLINW